MMASTSLYLLFDVCVSFRCCRISWLLTSFACWEAGVTFPEADAIDLTLVQTNEQRSVWLKGLPKEVSVSF